jgi:hypothetical protein
MNAPEPAVVGKSTGLCGDDRQCPIKAGKRHFESSLRLSTMAGLSGILLSKISEPLG